MESVRRKRRGHLPLVMKLVQRAIKEAMVEPAVDPVNCTVGEHHKCDKGESKEAVAPMLLCIVVELGVPSHLGNKEKRGG